MFKPATTTLICITSERVARADFGSAPARQMVFTWQGPRIASQSPEQALEAALATRPRCARDVWVLCEDVWTQTVALATPSVAGLQPEELARVLSFELESLSGLSAVESDIAYEAGEQEADLSHFWVTQVNGSLTLQMQKTIQQAGGTLRGVAHCAGLPSPWREQATRARWWRVEAWSDVTLCLDGTDDGRVRAQFVSGGPAREGWQAAVAQWLARSHAEHIEYLDAAHTPRRAALPHFDPLPPLDGEALQHWLALWAGALAGGDCRVPIVRPSFDIAARRRHARAGIASAVCALVACVGAGVWIHKLAQQVWSEVARLERPRQQSADLTHRISSLEDELRKLQKDVPKTGPDPTAVLRREKARIAALLDVLGRQDYSDRVITSLRSGDRGSLLIEGVALRTDSADGLAIGLAAELARFGWSTQGAQKSALLAAPDGGPWRFQITLLPQARGTIARPPRMADARAADGAGRREEDE